jgi:hypothetical protein
MAIGAEASGLKKEMSLVVDRFLSGLNLIAVAVPTTGSGKFIFTGL